MSAGIKGGSQMGGPSGQYLDVMPQTHEYRPFPEAIGGPAIDIFKPMPGYQQPQQPNMQPQQPNQGQQQHQQYFQQMHKNMDGMNEALKQIEGMQMPGQRYGGGNGGYTPGGGKGNKGISLF